MDKDALTYLNHPLDESILERGFKFLESFSGASIMANRFLLILQTLVRETRKRTRLNSAIGIPNDHQQNPTQSQSGPSLEDNDEHHVSFEDDLHQPEFSELEEVLYGTRLRGEFCFFGNEHPFAWMNW